MHRDLKSFGKRKKLPNRRKLRARRDKSREPIDFTALHDWKKGNFQELIRSMLGGPVKKDDQKPEVNEETK